jgi:hypothetical protein
VDTIITDEGISKEDKQRMENAGVEVIIAWLFRAIHFINAQFSTVKKSPIENWAFLMELIPTLIG